MTEKNGDYKGKYISGGLGFNLKVHSISVTEQWHRWHQAILLAFFGLFISSSIWPQSGFPND